MSAHSSVVRVATSPAGVIVENQPWYLPHELQKRFMSLVLSLFAIGPVTAALLLCKMLLTDKWKDNLMKNKWYILLAILTGFVCFTTFILEMINHDVKIHNPYSLLAFIARTFVFVAFSVLLVKAHTKIAGIIAALILLLVGILVSLIAINYINWIFRKFIWVIAVLAIASVTMFLSATVWYLVWDELVTVLIALTVAFVVLCYILIRLFFLINGSVYDLESDMGTYGRNLLYI
ncbi:uncharacterized protein LOC123293025 [Chrysoperla carnea]|uniref:uncharacterized protein LOC123293025 n=1 Tax=Chrysoperla carnea TaxID=189513 RepID=UPI001D06E12F|nr:uncharacterized protein LOC123293025 [Chrysoperla carnea]